MSARVFVSYREATTATNTSRCSDLGRASRGAAKKLHRRALCPYGDFACVCGAHTRHVKTDFSTHISRARTRHFSRARASSLRACMEEGSPVVAATTTTVVAVSVSTVQQQQTLAVRPSANASRGTLVCLQEDRLQQLLQDPVRAARIAAEADLLSALQQAVDQTVIATEAAATTSTTSSSSTASSAHGKKSRSKRSSTPPVDSGKKTHRHKRA